ncbi:MAG: 4Fe-4S dicluster domain-containing protein [Anaerolineales bacterium]
MTRVLYMDLSRCIYCRGCEVACEREHHGRSNMFVQLIDETFPVPMNCRHCENSPCTLVCPTQALHRESPEAVTIDAMKCIGCRLCTLACPFGATWFDPASKVARKCDLCLERTEAGLEPACVASCSSRALGFGELDVLVAQARRKPGRTVISRAGGERGTVITLSPNWNHDATHR